MLLCVYNTHARAHTVIIFVSNNYVIHTRAYISLVGRLAQIYLSKLDAFLAGWNFLNVNYLQRYVSRTLPKCYF